MVRIIAITVVLLSLVGPALGTGYVITEFSDDSVVNGNCTLREAIQAANTNTAVDECVAGSATRADSITLLAGTYILDLTATTDDDNALVGDLDIRSGLTIEGVSPQYTVIDGGGAAIARQRVLDIEVGSMTPVVVRGLSISGGHSPVATGGNVLVTSGLVEFVDSEIRSGKSVSGGGLTARDNANLRLRRSMVRDNEADGNGGGGIFVASTASLFVVDSAFTGNVSASNGGAIAVAGELRVYRTELVGNMANTGDGGGIYALGDTETTCDIQFSLFGNNQAQRGAGVFTTQQPCQIQQSALLNNKATVEGGGFHGSSMSQLRRSTVANNIAPRGAGVYSNGETLLDQVTVANNLGGGIYSNDNIGVSTEVTLFANNTGGNCQGQPPLFGAYNLDDGNSCGFVSSDDLPNFPNTNPMLGPLQDNGGLTPTMALLPGSPAIDVVDSRIQMGCQNPLDQRGYPRGRPRFQNASETVYFCDIGAYEVVPPHQVNTEADEVDANINDDICLTASGDCSLRAAIQQANATLGFEEIVLPEGTYNLSIFGGDDTAATGDLDLIDVLSIRGSGMATTIVNGVEPSRVFDSVAAPRIEGVQRPVVKILSNMTVTGGIVDGANGGGLRSTSPIRLERVAIIGNRAVNGAGIFCADNCRLEVVDSQIALNETNGAAQAAGNGGGLLQTGTGQSLIQRSQFWGNRAGLGAAGEAIRLHLQNSVIHDNAAFTTGAFFSSRAIIEDSSIALNTANAESGGFFLLDHSVIRNSIIAENTIAGVSKSCTFSPNMTESAGYNLTDSDADDCGLDATTDLVNTQPLFANAGLQSGAAGRLALAMDSAAVDSGDDANCPLTDWRGVNRPQDGDLDLISRCDRGAFELADQVFSDGFESQP